MSGRRFYCDGCEAWTSQDPAEASPTCGECGEAFTCGECGYEIDHAGTCQRPVELGVCPEAVAT